MNKKLLLGSLIFGIVGVSLSLMIWRINPTLITNVFAAGANPPPLDIAVVFDVSGSTLWESNCFGCWQEDTSLDILSNPYPSNGNYNPLDFNSPEDSDDTNDFDIFWGGDPLNAGDSAFAGHNVCSASPTPYVADGYEYSVHEAEFYSRDVPLHGLRISSSRPYDDRSDHGLQHRIHTHAGRGRNGISVGR